jgi:uncharacterized protein with FMN-binding domain
LSAHYRVSLEKYASQGEILMKKLMTLLFAAAVLISWGFTLAACPTEPEEEAQIHAPYGTAPGYFSGTVDSTVTGAHEGGAFTIKIELDLTNGYITSVRFPVTTGTTEGRGTLVLDKAKTEIVDKNSVEIDAFTGATETRDAVVDAGKQALATIGG